MKEIRRAAPAARRHAVVIVVIGTLVGALLIAGFERYRPSLREWLLSEPGQLAQRAKLVLLICAAAVSAPLCALAVHLWSLGARAIRAREYPPPGLRVIRDSPVVNGRSAVLRGRGFKVLALCLAGAAAVLSVLLWRLALAVSAH